MPLSTKTCDVSIIIPIYNEEKAIRPLIEAIVHVCQEMDYEIIPVNDGSTDQTAQELAALAEGNPRVRTLTLKKNFGQTAALAAGFDHSTGRVLIPMDGDGQNDPSDIPRLLEKIEEGFDVVSGWRKKRADRYLSRRLPSQMANALISFVTGVPLHDYGCTFKAYRRPVISQLQIHGEMHRFLPAWCAWQGGRVAEIAVLHHPRRTGQSKYGMTRIFKVIVDLLTLKFFSGYLVKPNYLFTGTAMVLFLMGVASAGAAIVDKFGPDRFSQFRIPLLLLSVFFALVAVFMVLMGFLAELLVRLYFEIRRQKPYHLADE